MKHRANPKFWQFYTQLPTDIQRLADENYNLLKADPRHPSSISRRRADSGPFVSASTTGPSPLKMVPMSFGFGSAITVIMTESLLAAAGDDLDPRHTTARPYTHPTRKEADDLRLCLA